MNGASSAADPILHNGRVTTLAVIRSLDEHRHLTIGLAYNLFTQKRKGEKDDFLNWVKTSTYKEETPCAHCSSPSLARSHTYA